MVNKRGSTTAGKESSSSSSVVEGVIDHIRKGVEAGLFAPGQRLIENEIQQAAGVSRGPVREAMRRLAAEGLLEIQHQKGARVRRFTREEVEVLYDVRESVEGIAAKFAARYAKEGNLCRELESVVRSYDGTAPRYMEYNEQFHELIVQMSQSQLLQAVLMQLRAPVSMRGIYRFADVIGIERAHQQHLAIVEAIKAGDEEGAERAMRAHTRSVKRAVLAVWPF
jgi:DNA-binding GntR family transcriptional regulator